MYWDAKVVEPLSDYRIYIETEDGSKEAGSTSIN